MATQHLPEQAAAPRRPPPNSCVREALYIDGRWQSPSGREAIAVHDCTTEAALGSVPVGGPAEVDAAVGAATRALGSWARTDPQDRADQLARLSAALKERAGELSSLISAEVGTATRLCGPIQVESAIGLLDVTIDVLRSRQFEERAGNSLVVQQPIGVVAAITPWNYPLFQTMAKLGAALAAGCTVVHKPSGLAPLSAFVLAEAAEAAELPRGAYNLVTGPGASVGEALSSHAGVSMVSFTGSTEAGIQVYTRAAASIKRVALELGGKSASVLLDDAELDVAVRSTINRAFLNSGQTCDAWTRLLVPRAQLGAVLDLAIGATERLVVGDPFEARTRLGPLVSADQLKRVRGYVDGALQDGAECAVGGSDPLPEFERGHFVRPTILTRVTPEMTVAREEVFGPVLAVMTYETEEEALAIANGTRYGLSGAVWSADPERAQRFARGMQSGQVVVNGGKFNPHAPAGGVKMSGLGREFGRYGMDEFLEPKALQL